VTAAKGSYVTSHWERLGRSLGWVEMRVEGMDRSFWVPPYYRAVFVRAQDGRPFTIRGLAAELGQPKSNVGHALAMMRSWGFFRLAAIRGRLGSTRIVRVARDLIDGARWRARQAAARAGVLGRSAVRLPGTSKYLRIDGEDRAP
jgi:hypothetical protein